MAFILGGNRMVGFGSALEIAGGYEDDEEFI
jgi:hypothetical protein